MGTRLVRLLLARGEAVRVLDMDRDGVRVRMESMGVEFRSIDIAKPDGLTEALEGASAVVHLAALLLAHGQDTKLDLVNREGTRNLLDASRSAGVRRFVHISSISVCYRRQNPYSISKQESEVLVRSSGLDWTILRPTLAWGDPAAAEYGKFHSIAWKWPILPLPDGGRALKTPVHVDDLAHAFVACLDEPRSIGRILALAGPRQVALGEMAREIRRACGTRGLTLPIPVFLAETFARRIAPLCRRIGIPPLLDWQTLTGLVEDACPSSKEASDLLGWSPRPWEAQS